MKGKGSNAERELVKMFWEAGWAAHRIAGSGSSRFPSPDLIAGNYRKKLAIECKATRSKNQYVSELQAGALKDFAEVFGAQPWVGVRFNREEWYFVPLQEMSKTAKGNLVFSLEKAKLLGLTFDDLVREKF